MDRRTFLTMTGLGVAGLALPFGRVIAAEALVTTLDVAKKKALADAAMQAATSAGATYCDVRIGRYLRQFVITREDKVENVVNTESTGIGVRVLVNGAWGFSATNALNTQGVVKAAQQAAAIAKANSKMQTAPVQLAKTPGVLASCTGRACIFEFALAIAAACCAALAAPCVDMVFVAAKPHAPLTSTRTPMPVDSVLTTFWTLSSRVITNWRR